jgi:hypothetical protein
MGARATPGRKYLRKWLAEPAQLSQAIDACDRLARPFAAREIARILAAKAGVKIEKA